MLKRYKWLALSLIFLLFLIILLLQSLVNVQERMTPPSERWGHSLKIGETVSVKSPFLEYGEDELIKAAFLTENSIEAVTMDTDYKTNTIAYPLNGIDLTSFVKHDDQLLYILNRQLYAGILSQEGIRSSKLLLDEPTLSYAYWQNATPLTYVAIGTPTKVMLYSMTKEGVDEVSSISDLPQVEDYASRRIVQLTGNEETLNMLIFSKPTETSYHYDFLTYDLKLRQWNVRPIQHRETGMKLNKFYSDIDFAVDDNNTLHVITSFSTAGNSGSERNLEYFSFNLTNGNIENELRTISVPSFHGYATSSVYDVNVIGFDSSNQLRLTANALTKAGRDQATMRMVELVLRDGKVNEMNFVSSRYTFARSSSAVSNEEGDFLVWLEKATEKTYDVKVGSTSLAYNQSTHYMTKDMFVNAMYSVINSFVFSLLTIAITSFWATPGLAIVAWFEWRKESHWIEKHWSHVMMAAVLSTVIFQIAFFEMIFYKPSIIPFMPAWLTFNGAPVAIPIVFALFIYIAVMLYRKSMEIPNLLGLFTFFIVTDLLLLDFLYAPYIV